MAAAKYKIKKAPRLELSGVKTFQGMEGQGLNADLWFDGKKVAFVLDEGCGGEMRIHVACVQHNPPVFAHAELRAAEEYVKGLNLPSEDMDLTVEQDLESLINETVDDIANDKRMRRLAKDNVLFTLPDDKPGEFHMAKHRGKPEAAKAYWTSKYPGGIKFIEV